MRKKSSIDRINQRIRIGNKLVKALKKRGNSSHDSGLVSSTHGEAVYRRLGGVTHEFPITPTTSARLANSMRNSHAKGMAKIGRQKSDLNGGNSVNRAPKNHTTRTSQAQRIASKIAVRLAKRRYSDNTMGMSGSAAGSSVYRSVGGKTMAFALSSSAANKLHKEMQRPMRKSIGMAGAKRPTGPASASSVSAARKKAWATRRKKFGKSGGKKRR